MEIIAHGLSAAAAAITARRSAAIRLSIPWAVWWGVFPDVLAFGPSIGAGVWLAVSDMLNAGHGHFRFVHVGPHLYPAVHSLIVFLVVFGAVSLIARRPVFEMFGWLLHILIDIPTHSLSYYATRFLWPVSAFRVDGIAWWTRWFWLATYAVLFAVYFLIWRKGWLSPARLTGAREPEAAGDLPGRSS